MLAIKARADELNNLHRLAELDSRKHPLPDDFEVQVYKVAEDWEAMREVQTKHLDAALARMHERHGKGCSGEARECVEYEYQKCKVESEEET